MIIQDYVAYSQLVGSRQLIFLGDRLNNEVGFISPCESQEDQARYVKSKCKETNVARGRSKVWLIQRAKRHPL